MKCKKCKIDIDGTFGSGKYCSRSCANSRIRTEEINKKISEKLKNKYYHKKKEHKCNSCNVILGKRKKYCDICHKYIKNTILFKKLKIKEYNLQKANTLAIIKLKELYFDKHLSTLEIYEKYKIKENTLFWFFKKNNIPLRNFSQGQLNGIKNGRITPIDKFYKVPYKQGWYTTWFGKKVYLRSSYEFKIAIHLDNKKIYYEVESKKIPYIYNNEEHIYIPDFWIPDWNLLLETKGGYFYEKNKKKINCQLKSAEDYGYLTLLLVDSMIDNYIR